MTLIGLGSYLPRYRIAQRTINAAWSRGGGRGAKAVALADEDVISMGFKAARRGVASVALPPERVGAVFACTTSSGYLEGAVAAAIAFNLGIEGELTALDLGQSLGAAGAALAVAADALPRVGHALVVAADKLCGRPGSSEELLDACGAAAVVLGPGPGAKLLGAVAHTSGFVGRYRREGQPPQQPDDRFALECGYLAHVVPAARRLETQTDLSLEAFEHLVLPAPAVKWAARALKRLGLDGERLRSVAARAGHTGCAGPLLDLVLALEVARPGERVLATSYGAGGATALAFELERALASEPTLEAQLEETVELDYPAYLRCHGLLGGAR